jgi:hypothetical protein
MMVKRGMRPNKTFSYVLAKHKNKKKKQKKKNGKVGGDSSIIFVMASNVLRTSWRLANPEKRWKGKAKIVIGDHYSKVTSESDDIFRELRKGFSFLHPSFWFMRGRFGGSSAKSRFASQTAFISEKGRFPTGLLSDVILNVRFFCFFF